MCQALIHPVSGKKEFLFHFTVFLMLQEKLSCMSTVYVSPTFLLHCITHIDFFSPIPLRALSTTYVRLVYHVTSAPAQCSWGNKFPLRLASASLQTSEASFSLVQTVLQAFVCLLRRRLNSAGLVHKLSANRGCLLPRKSAAAAQQSLHTPTL